MKTTKNLLVGALVLGGLVAVTTPASADYYRLRSDRREYRHDLRNGADAAELAGDRREIFQDRREVYGDRRELRQDHWYNRPFWRWW
jgi:hypothetical protein